MAKMIKAKTINLVDAVNETFYKDQVSNVVGQFQVIDLKDGIVMNYTSGSRLLDFVSTGKTLFLGFESLLTKRKIGDKASKSFFDRTKYSHVIAIPSPDKVKVQKVPEYLGLTTDEYDVISDFELAVKERRRELRAEALKEKGPIKRGTWYEAKYYSLYGSSSLPSEKVSLSYVDSIKNANFKPLFYIGSTCESYHVKDFINKLNKIQETLNAKTRYFGVVVAPSVWKGVVARYVKESLKGKNPDFLEATFQKAKEDFEKKMQKAGNVRYGDFCYYEVERIVDGHVVQKLEKKLGATHRLVAYLTAIVDNYVALKNVDSYVKQYYKEVNLAETDEKMRKMMHEYEMVSSGLEHALVHDFDKTVRYIKVVDAAVAAGVHIA